MMMNPSLALALSVALPAALPFALPREIWPRTRVSLAYLWRHGRLPDVAEPELFTEWVQWRKLRDRDPGFAMLTDKLYAKSLASGLIGAQHVIPTLWHGTVLPVRAPWTMPFIVKANHGCNQYVVVRSDADWQHARSLAPAWLPQAYGRWLDEWHYTMARRMLLVEPFIGETASLPLDYKVFVFGGVAQCIQVHLDRASDHRWVQFDRHWQRLSASTADADMAPPHTLAAMLAAAEKIAGERDHLRVDFYEVGGMMYFGETCLFPGSGLDPFTPASLDAVLGRYWTRARH
jgi:hypothetical protein